MSAKRQRTGSQDASGPSNPSTESQRLADNRRQPFRGGSIELGELDGEVATLIVGPDRLEYKMHRELLCRTSSFFSACLDGRFLESNSGEIELPNVDSTAFRYFMTWAYSGNLGPTGSPHAMPHDVLLDIYLLAHEKQIDGLANFIVDAMYLRCEVNKQDWPGTFPEAVWTDLPPGDGMRRLLIDSLLWRPNDLAIRETCERAAAPLPQAAIADIIEAFAQECSRLRAQVPARRSRLLTVPARKNRTDYHTK